MVTDHHKVTVRSWPALVALAIVVLLSIGMLAVDFAINGKTAERTTELVDNSLRSIALADDLRYQAYRLSQPGLDVEQIASIRIQIEADGRAYDPIATGVGEAAQWDRLQALLAHLQHEQPMPTPAASATLVAEIETVIARLVEINQRDAREAVAVIDDAHRNGLYADALGLAITLGLAIAIALALMRSLRRQRALLAMHLTSLDERARELEAFAARTAHDLKGPLNPVAGYADLLGEQESPTVRELASRIRRAADRMAGIIDNLLSLSVAGHPRAGTAAVRAVVDEVLDDVRADLRDVGIATNLADCTVACSASALSQILRNVIANALKYRSNERRLVLGIDVRRGERTVEIAVSDNGVGMTDETVAHAFEPYYRAPSASGAGHGLGLAIVKRTLEAVGGTAVIVSTPGQGTRVTIQVPVA